MQLKRDFQKATTRILIFKNFRTWDSGFSRYPGFSLPRNNSWKEYADNVQRCHSSTRELKSGCCYRHRRDVNGTKMKWWVLTIQEEKDSAKMLEESLAWVFGIRIWWAQIRFEWILYYHHSWLSGLLLLRLEKWQFWRSCRGLKSKLNMFPPPTTQSASQQPPPKKPEVWNAGPD